MGRWSWSNRSTVEDCLSIDISFLNQHNFLIGYRSGALEWKRTLSEVKSSIGIEVKVDYDGSGENYIRFKYSKTSRFSEEKENFDYKVRLTTTHCHFGGIRYWFVCPLIVNSHLCERKVGKLYLPPGGKYFGCRHCYDLTYTSCRESHKFDRLFALLAHDVPGTTPEMVKQILSKRLKSSV